MLSGLGVLLMPGSIRPGSIAHGWSILARRQRSRPYNHAPYNHAHAVFNAAKTRRAILLGAAALLTVLLGSAPASAAPLRILAFGDSLIAGYGLAPGEAFPDRLQARLAADGYPVQIANGGVSGDTSAGGLARLDWALADKPDIVLVEFGANDMLRGIDPKVTHDNLDKIMARIAQSGAKILLLGMKAPSNWGREYQQSFDAIYPTLAEKYHAPLYPFFLDGVAANAALNQADGLHPNPKGVARIVDGVSPYLERLLGRTASAGGSSG
jgi:acyl-CoA thioesterase I